MTHDRRPEAACQTLLVGWLALGACLGQQRPCRVAIKTAGDMPVLPAKLGNLGKLSVHGTHCSTRMVSALLAMALQEPMARHMSTSMVALRRFLKSHGFKCCAHRRAVARSLNGKC